MVAIIINVISLMRHARLLTLFRLLALREEGCALICCNKRRRKRLALSTFPRAKSTRMARREEERKRQVESNQCHRHRQRLLASYVEYLEQLADSRAGMTQRRKRALAQSMAANAAPQQLSLARRERCGAAGNHLPATGGASSAHGVQVRRRAGSIIIKPLHSRISIPSA